MRPCGAPASHLQVPRHAARRRLTGVAGLCTPTWRAGGTSAERIDRAMSVAFFDLDNTLLAGDASRVRRVACRFAAMVLMPSTLTLVVDALADDGVWYTVLNAEGRPAIQGGFVGFRGA